MNIFSTTTQEFAVVAATALTLISFLTSGWVVREIVRFCAGEAEKVERS
jgi:hypothetical protein